LQLDPHEDPELQLEEESEESDVELLPHEDEDEDEELAQLRFRSSSDQFTASLNASWPLVSYVTAS
jgi:hypothetical protein